MVFVSMQGRPEASVAIMLSIGSASTEFSDSMHGRLQALAQRVVAEALDEAVGCVQAEDGEGVHAGCHELGREDRRVAQGVAVDLARQR